MLLALCFGMAVLAGFISAHLIVKRQQFEFIPYLGLDCDGSIAFQGEHCCFEKSSALMT